MSSTLTSSAHTTQTQQRHSPLPPGTAAAAAPENLEYMDTFTDNDFHQSSSELHSLALPISITVELVDYGM